MWSRKVKLVMEHFCQNQKYMLVFGKKSQNSHVTTGSLQTVVNAGWLLSP